MINSIFGSFFFSIPSNFDSKGIKRIQVANWSRETEFCIPIAQSLLCSFHVTPDREREEGMRVSIINYFENAASFGVCVCVFALFHMLLKPRISPFELKSKIHIVLAISVLAISGKSVRWKILSVFWHTFRFWNVMCSGKRNGTFGKFKVQMANVYSRLYIYHYTGNTTQFIESDLEITYSLLNLTNRYMRVVTKF